MAAAAAAARAHAAPKSKAKAKAKSAQAALTALVGPRLNSRQLLPCGATVLPAWSDVLCAALFLSCFRAGGAAATST